MSISNMLGSILKQTFSKLSINIRRVISSQACIDQWVYILLCISKNTVSLTSYEFLAFWFTKIHLKHIPYKTYNRRFIGWLRVSIWSKELQPEFRTWRDSFLELKVNPWSLVCSYSCLLNSHIRALQVSTNDSTNYRDRLAWQHHVHSVLTGIYSHPFHLLRYQFKEIV